jgi:hypothetical protein
VPPRDGQTVKQFLDTLPVSCRAVVRALRGVIRSAAPHAAESVVWGALSYHRPAVGGRVKGAVCQVVVRAGRVRLDFLHGVRLTDPYRLLAGTAKSKRHVAIATAADARRPGVAALIRESADLDPDSWPDIKP